MKKGKAGRVYSLTEKGRKYLEALQEILKKIEEIEEEEKAENEGFEGRGC